MLEVLQDRNVSLRDTLRKLMPFATVIDSGRCDDIKLGVPQAVESSEKTGV